MTIRPEDILFYTGGAALKKYGTLARRTRPSVELGEVFTRASTGTWVDRSGVIHSASTNVPRIDHWEAGAAADPFLLLEKTKDNICLQSEDFGTTWAVTRASISTNVDTAPNGTTSADRLIEDSTASANHYVDQLVVGVLTTTDDVAFSVFAKAGSRDWLLVQVFDSVNDSIYAFFDLANGVVGSTSADNNGVVTRHYMEAYGNGWYRCVLVGYGGWEAGNSYACKVRCGLTTGDEVYNHNGDGSSYISLWGAQIEGIADVATSYVPTAAAAVTRESEPAYFDVPLDAAAMSIYLKFYERMVDVASGDTVRLLHIGTNAAATDPRLVITKNSSQQYGFTHDNASTAYSASQSTASATRGTVVELLCTLKSDGQLEISQSLDAATATTVQNTNPYTLVQWAGQHVWLNGVNGSDAGTLPLIAAIIARGEKTLADFRAII